VKAPQNDVTPALFVFKYSVYIVFCFHALRLTLFNGSSRAGFPRFTFYLQMEADAVSETL